MGIKMIVIDVDGTMTDGKIYITNSYEEIKSFNVKDGYAIKKILPQLAVLPVIITGRKSKIVTYRADELGIKEIYQGVDNKLGVYEHVKKKYNIGDSNVACIGDDYTDLPLLKKAKISACPIDATELVKEKCKYVLSKKGGEGAVHEFILIIFKELVGYEYNP